MPWGCFTKYEVSILKQDVQSLVIATYAPVKPSNAKTRHQNKLGIVSAWTDKGKPRCMAQRILNQLITTKGSDKKSLINGTDDANYME
ncbi:nuclear hormone receptor HR96 X4 [Biomphalaria glabrata]|nr:nuclear hormone receptor HR96 X4 [Biomphalaria glabrata]